MYTGVRRRAYMYSYRACHRAEPRFTSRLATGATAILLLLLRRGTWQRRASKCCHLSAAHLALYI